MRKSKKLWSLSKEQFAALVKRHIHVVNILEELGFKRTSGSMAKIIRKRIADEGIDISHMKKSSIKGGLPIYSLKDILVENSKYHSLDRLKKRIVKANLKEYKCVNCNNTGTWKNKPLSLQLDHINGKPNDHRLENIRFLCPNCHSQTDNWCSKNREKI